MLEGADGQLSIRRVLAVWFSLLLSFVSVWSVVKCQAVSEAVVAALLSAVLVLLGLTTWQNIQDKKENDCKI